MNVDGLATSDDKGKSRMDLLPWESIREVGHVAGFGLEKHPNKGNGPAGMNWRRGCLYSKHLGAAFRHIEDWISGKDKDPESGRHPLAHAIWRLMVLLAYELGGYGKMAGGIFQDVRTPGVKDEQQ